MLRPLSLEDIENKTDNKYLAVYIAAKRARQLSEGAESSIDISAIKDSTIALHELATGKLNYAYKETKDSEQEKTDELSDTEYTSEFKKLFKEELVDDSGIDYDDEEAEEGI